MELRASLEVCVPYEVETPQEHFQRIAPYFKKTSPNWTIDVPNLDQDTALKIYGLTQQAQFGDNNTPEPSYWDMAANYKWHAWTAEKGKSQDEARTEFVEMAIPMLEERGVNTTDP